MIGKNKKTNLVFMMGYPGSSKTTVLAALVDYLTTNPNHVALTRGDSDNHEGNVLVNKLISDLKNHKFPPITPVEKLYEYDIACKKKQMEEWLQLTFLEMSGEKARTIKAEYGGSFSKEVEVYLKNVDHPIMYLLLVGYDELEALKDAHETKKDHDSLFAEFISYIHGASANREEDDALRIGLVVSKFDRERTHDINFKDYVQKNLPKTFNLLTTRDVVTDARIFPFSIGDVNIGEGSEVNTIKNVDLADCEEIVEWMFEMFAENYTPIIKGGGKKKNPPFYKRLLG